MPIATCQICKIKFKVHQCILNIGKGKYCSRGCGNRARSTKIEKECLYCGNKFTVQPYRIRDGKGNYCSFTCRARGTAKSPLGRFLEKIIVLPGPDACWLWGGTHLESGYGTFYVDNKKILVHRFAYESFRGPISKGMECCHSCDIPMCVRISHLFISSRAGNAADAVSKGRMTGRKGLEKIMFIIQNPDISVKKLAAKLSVPSSTIRRIRKGETYKHIPRPVHPPTP